MKSLPPNLSSLKNVTHVNISNNPFESFESVVASLQTLPNLKFLNVSLQQNEEVELVLKSFPGLAYLNDQGTFILSLMLLLQRSSAAILRTITKKSKNPLKKMMSSQKTKKNQ